MQQHGGADENVPAFHSRRMSQLITQTNHLVPSRYVELDGKGHWFEGIMSTLPLREFYAEILDPDRGWPVVPQNFRIVISNPGDMGPRGGLVVDQLASPNQLGKIDVSRNSSMAVWSLKTSNIYRFHLMSSRACTLPAELIVDHDHFLLSALEAVDNHWFVRSEEGYWQVSVKCSACLSPRLILAR